jgi:hypothetical protein
MNQRVAVSLKATMTQQLKAVFAAIVLLGVALLAAPGARAQQSAPNPRIALVIGNATYRDAALATTANDAGLVAQTLQAAGFEMFGQTFAYSAFSRNHFSSPGSVSGLIASTGHSGTQTPQSMHSSGGMTSMFSPS